MKKMTHCLCLLALLGVLASCQKSLQSAPADKAENVPVPGAPTSATVVTATTYTNLVWSDEFSGTAVDGSSWNYDLGGGGWGNNEKEYYQAANATVDGGNLIITAKKERVKSNAYTSARLKTEGKREFTRGRIEARIKLPLGQGLWPAFWMLGANIGTVGWPACGEIDIMEHINTENTIYGTLHWNDNGHRYKGGNIAGTPSDYHVYAVEWDVTSIRWYVDNTLYYTHDIQNGVNGSTAFQKPFFIILNLAVGGNWPGQTIDNSKLPARMYVDWVRVYQ